MSDPRMTSTELTIEQLPPHQVIYKITDRRGDHSYVLAGSEKEAVIKYVRQDFEAGVREVLREIERGSWPEEMIPDMVATYLLTDPDRVIALLKHYMAAREGGGTHG